MRFWWETLLENKERFFSRRGHHQWEGPRGGSANGVMFVVLFESVEGCGAAFVSFSFVFKVGLVGLVLLFVSCATLGGF